MQNICKKEVIIMQKHLSSWCYRAWVYTSKTSRQNETATLTIVLTYHPSLKVFLILIF